MFYAKMFGRQAEKFEAIMSQNVEIRRLFVIEETTKQQT